MRRHPNPESPLIKFNIYWQLGDFPPTLLPSYGLSDRIVACIPFFGFDGLGGRQRQYIRGRAKLSDSSSQASTSTADWELIPRALDGLSTAKWQSELSDRGFVGMS